MSDYTGFQSPKPEELIRQARQAIHTGNRPQARRLLQQAAQQDPQNVTIWLWLAKLAPTAPASLEYVRQAEKLKPNDPRIIQAKLWAESQLPPGHKAPTAVSRKPTAVRPVALLFILVLLLAVPLLWFYTRPAPNTATPTAVAQAASPTAVVQDQIASQPQQLRLAGAAAPTATPAHTSTPFVPAKQIAANSLQDPRPTWTVTPSPTPTPTPSPTWVPTYVSNGEQSGSPRPFGVAADEKWINVDLTNQRLTAYEGNEVVFSTLISSGTSNHPTVTGQFRIWLRYESQTMDGRLLGYDYYLENVPYVMYFYQDYALHGTFWHSNFGTPMSHGCVNLETSDAAWLFNWASLGTVVNVHY